MFIVYTTINLLFERLNKLVAYTDDLYQYCKIKMLSTNFFDI